MRPSPAPPPDPEPAVTLVDPLPDPYPTPSRPVGTLQNVAVILIIRQEPPMTGAKWADNVATNSRQLWP
jgi:hypothetical protein